MHHCDALNLSTYRDVSRRHGDKQSDWLMTPEVPGPVFICNQEFWHADIMNNEDENNIHLTDFNLLSA